MQNNASENTINGNTEDLLQNNDNNSTEEQLTELEQALAKANEYHDAWLRAKADGDNIRRRSIEDLDKMRKFAVEGFAEGLLSVMDSLQAVLADNSGNIETMKQGIDLTMKQLQTAFDKQKVVAINPVGEMLDPSYHQAISSIPSDKPANTVIDVMQKGYKLSERLLRPALVVVSAGN
ncbi:MAG: protein GrpE [Pseudomonadota bacterium]